MPSTAEMRAELKVMRESSADHVPVSRMKKADISGAIERMKHLTETTPAIAQTKKGLPDSMKPEKKEKKVKMVESPSSSEDEAPMKVKASKKPVVVKEKAPAVKETMVQRMARIRALKGKKE
jgi:hypothetical protein